MAIGKSDSRHYQNIADSIRRNLQGHEGESARYGPDEMANGIDAVATHQYKAGYNASEKNTAFITRSFGQRVYGEQRESALAEIVAQATSDFDSLKTAFLKNDVVVENNEPTANYADKVDAVFDIGVTSGFENGKAEGREEGYSEGKADGKAEGYSEGYFDGKASVKHIRFYLYHAWEYLDFCAFEGMTWREWVEQKFSYNFIIDGNKVKYDDGGQPCSVAGVSADDIIVANGYYETMPPPEEWWLIYNGETLSLFRTHEHGAEAFVNSEYNTLGFTIDDNGYLRMPTGEFVYCSTMGDEKRYVEGGYPAISVHSAGDFYYCTDFIAEQWADGHFDIYIVQHGYSVAFKFVSGMTWQEFAVSNFSDAINIYSDTVGHSWGAYDALYLNGVKVKPTDVIVSGVEYEGRSE